MSSNLDLQVHESLAWIDAQWDRFLSKTRQGQFEQTSLWAQVKGGEGWKPLRLVFTRDNAIVAGCQILTTVKFPIGRIGYVTKGPVLESDEPETIRRVVQTLEQCATSHGLQAVFIQPPDTHADLSKYFKGLAYCQNHVITGENVTGAIVIDVQEQNLDDIFGAMKRKKRQSVNKGRRSGVKVDEGNQNDLPTFHDFLVISSHRQGVSPRPATVDQLQRMWEAFAPYGFVKLFWAKCEGQPVSGILAVPFGRRVYLLKFGWSGEYGSRSPNDILYWEIIRWAKQRGYAQVFIHGVDRRAACAVLKGKPRPQGARHNSQFFKLGFGGTILLFPEITTFIPNRFRRWGYHFAMGTRAAWLSVKPSRRS